MKQGIRNANDAISMIQVADGALQQLTRFSRSKGRGYALYGVSVACC
ncbi:hypothetical protein [Desulfonatronum thioautotrophicum]|nr:hypothetical protein [Desulfonatronum thioautotrophicum]